MGEVRDEVAAVIVATEQIRSGEAEPEVDSAARDVGDEFRQILVQLDEHAPASRTQLLEPSIALLRELHRMLSRNPALYGPFLQQIERAGQSILNAMPGRGRTPGRFP